MEAFNHTRVYAVTFFLLAALGIGYACYRVLLRPMLVKGAGGLTP